MIKCVVFDVGGVLVKSRMDSVRKGIGEILGINKDLIESFWMSHKEDIIKGRQKLKEYCELFDKNFSVKNSFEAYVKTYERIQKTELNKEGLELITKLKKSGYKTGLISVVGDAFAKMNRSIGLYSVFDVCILSCEVGFSKSEPGLYKTFLEKSKLKPEECIVIDDRKPPLEIAKSLGFKTVLFENNQRLKGELEKLGVKM